MSARGFFSFFGMAIIATTCFLQADTEVSAAADSTSVQAYIDCSGLTEDQKDFAKHLRSGHRALFCQKFNEDQRQEAMDMMEEPDMSPDDAVEAVAQRNGMMTPMTQQKKGNCPLK